MAKHRAAFYSRLSLRESSVFATFAEQKATLIFRSMLSVRIHQSVRKRSISRRAIHLACRRDLFNETGPCLRRMMNIWLQATDST